MKANKVCVVLFVFFSFSQGKFAYSLPLGLWSTEARANSYVVQSCHKPPHKFRSPTNSRVRVLPSLGASDERALPEEQSELTEEQLAANDMILGGLTDRTRTTLEALCEVQGKSERLYLWQIIIETKH